jgi:arylformamidase
MNKLVQLSYHLQVEGPCWPGNSMRLRQFMSIRKGAICNQHLLELFNRFATHIDGPNHFHEAGKQLAELPLEYFCYSKPFLAKIPKSFCEKITPEDLLPFEARIREADLLLLRTGFSPYRAARTAEYCEQGPGIAFATSRYLIEEFPPLRAIGLDCVSLSSYSDPAGGILSHQYILGMYRPGRFLFIIEELDLSRIRATTLQRGRSSSEPLKAVPPSWSLNNQVLD